MDVMQRQGRADSSSLWAAASSAGDSVQLCTSSTVCRGVRRPCAALQQHQHRRRRQLAPWRQLRHAKPYLLLLLVAWSTVAPSAQFAVRRKLLEEAHKKTAQAPASDSALDLAAARAQFMQWLKKHVHRVQETKQALTYLRKFNYLADDAATGRPAAVRVALSAFQRVAGLQPTGELDADSVTAMKAPRCGNMDIDDELMSPPRVSKWTSQLDTRNDALRLRWYIDNYTSDLSRDTVRDVVQRAFRLWSRQADVPTLRKIALHFEEAASAGEADIVITWATGQHGDGYPFDGAGNQSNTLAHTFFPEQAGSGALGGDIHFDEHEKWLLDTNPHRDGVYLPYVLAHEIGHSLGLGHSQRPEAVMNPIYKRVPLDSIVLDMDDKCAINWNYVGETQTCLLVFVLVEMLPQSNASDAQRQALVSHTGVDLLSTSDVTKHNDVVMQHAVVEQHIRSTINKLKDSEIPVCSNSNDVKMQYEVLLEHNLEMNSSAAQQYGPLVCNFLDTVAALVERRTGSRVRRSNRPAAMLSVHQYNERGQLQRRPRSRRQRRHAAPDGRRIDEEYVEEIIRLVASGGSV